MYLTAKAAGASMAELVLTNVSKIYRSRGKADVHAVRDLSLTVVPGEICALLGSSGCGKTSTLRMIAGFEDVSSGRISLNDRDIHTLPPSQRGVAMAFEAYSLYPPLTIGENMSFALKALRLSATEADARVRAMAEMLEISDILGKYPTSISGGQQQRVSLGRALVRPADLYLLDEPMGQLEPQLRAILRGRIKHYLREHNCTTILVTHDQTEANALADRIAVMEGGVLQQYATPADLKARPANLFTGTFIGEPPMNVLQAEASAAGKGVSFEIANGQKLTYGAEELRRVPSAIGAAHGKVALGVRPYALHLGKGQISGKVISCQWLGDQTHVAAEVGGAMLVSVAHEHVELHPGETVSFKVEVRDLHLFDATSGVALAHGSDGR
jgi:multiple sugar transport system ATP-binding protein